MLRAASTAARGLVGVTGPVLAAAAQAPGVAATVAADDVGGFLRRRLGLWPLLQRAYTLGYESLGSATTASLKGSTVLVTGSTE